MFSSPIDEIKSRLDIVDVIGGYIKLQKAGANYRALCPFHLEKRPSFFISPSRQIWHCFGACGDGGDIFKFVMKIEGLEFGDALRVLARRAGVELKKQDPKIRTERERQYEICELACQFFQKQLKESRAGQKAKEYLLARKINEESIEKWRLGYGPDVWQGLSDFLVGRGYKREEITQAGLAVKRENREQGTGNNYYDRFRARIMFPIFDINSQVIGFTGRIFNNKDEVAKYVNTPNTLLYDKSRVLYGLDKAKIAIRKEDRCILVEGQTDVIMSHQADIKNVVATSGTALTPYQLAILKRYTENLITAFDMDIAGDSATKRGITLTIGQGFNVKVITMPPKKDPADIVSENESKWQEMVLQTKSILDFYFETTFAKYELENVEPSVSITGEQKKESSKILLPLIKKIPNRIEQSHWVQELAKRLEVKENDIEAELKKIQLSPRQNFWREDEARNSKSRKERLEERIISLILRTPENISFLDDNYFSLLSVQTREILTGLGQKTVPQKLKDLLEQLSFRAEVEGESDYLEFGAGLKPEEEIRTCFQQIELMEIKNKLAQISTSIKAAEGENNLEKVSSLTREFNELCLRLTNF